MQEVGEYERSVRLLGATFRVVFIQQNLCDTQYTENLDETRKFKSIFANVKRNEKSYSDFPQKSSFKMKITDHA